MGPQLIRIASQAADLILHQSCMSKSVVLSNCPRRKSDLRFDLCRLAVQTARNLHNITPRVPDDFVASNVTITKNP